MNTIGDLEQALAAFEELLELDDEKLEQSKSVIVDSLTHSLTGPETMLAFEEMAKIYDLQNYSYTEIQKDLEDGKDTLYAYFAGLKEKYPESQVKQEIIDMIYGLVETHLNLAMMFYSNRTKINVGIELNLEEAKLPTYAHEGDQGADIYAPANIIVPANSRGFMVHTGIKMLIPQGWAVSIRPRSGMSKNTPLRISNSPATIDQQYRGEVKILFDNLSNEDYEIKAGDRIAQFIVEKNYQAVFQLVDTVEPFTERGEGGFGSTGN